MAEYTPDQNFKHPVCRGSWAFGNNCKVCERCQATHPGRAGTQLLTNPKHTDTSRIADLRFQVSEKMPINHSDLSCLFDRIEALEAENERLREALEKIARLRTDLRGDFSLGSKQSDIARAALGEKQ